MSRPLLASLGVIIAQNSALPLGRRGGGGEADKKLGGDRCFCQIAHSSRFHTSNPLRHPALSISQEHFPSKDILFFPNLPGSKNWPVEQIF